MCVNHIWSPLPFMILILIYALFLTIFVLWIFYHFLHYKKNYILWATETLAFPHLIFLNYIIFYMLVDWLMWEMTTFFAFLPLVCRVCLFFSDLFHWEVSILFIYLFVCLFVFVVHSVLHHLLLLYTICYFVFDVIIQVIEWREGLKMWLANVTLGSFNDWLPNSLCSHAVFPCENMDAFLSLKWVIVMFEQSTTYLCHDDDEPWLWSWWWSRVWKIENTHTSRNDSWYYINTRIRITFSLVVVVAVLW